MLSFSTTARAKCQDFEPMELLGTELSTTLPQSSENGAGDVEIFDAEYTACICQVELLRSALAQLEAL